jgi:hypothetical protein
VLFAEDDGGSKSDHIRPGSRGWTGGGSGSIFTRLGFPARVPPTRALILNFIRGIFLENGEPKSSC